MTVGSDVSRTKIRRLHGRPAPATGVAGGAVGAGWLNEGGPTMIRQRGIARRKLSVVIVVVSILVLGAVAIFARSHAATAGRPDEAVRPRPVERPVAAHEAAPLLLQPAVGEGRHPTSEDIRSTGVPSAASESARTANDLAPPEEVRQDSVRLQEWLETLPEEHIVDMQESGALHQYVCQVVHHLSGKPEAIDAFLTHVNARIAAK